MEKTPYERSRDAATAIRQAVTDYLVAAYEHDRYVRGITPLAAYKDVADTCKVLLDSAQSDAAYALQSRVRKEM